MIDRAKLFQMAIQYVQEDDKVIYILQSNLSLSHLEENFLYKLLPESTKKLPLQQVFGVNIPERTSSIQSFGASLLHSAIYMTLDHAKESGNLSLFTAKTEEMEIKTILQKIKMSQSQLDENVIYYTNSDKYMTPIYHLSQKGDIPITFGEGIPILLSRPGRLASGIITMDEIKL